MSVLCSFHGNSGRRRRRKGRSSSLAGVDAFADLPRVDGDRLCAVVRLVDAHQSVSKLKHVVAEAYDYKLCVLGPFLGWVVGRGMGETKKIEIKARKKKEKNEVYKVYDCASLYNYKYLDVVCYY